MSIIVKPVFGGGAVINSAGSDPAPYPAEVGSMKVVLVFGSGAVIDSAASDPAPYPAEVGFMKVVIA